MKIKILFVCLGNICRSPLAKGLFNQFAMESGLSDFLEADACGTAGHHQGQEPDARTLRNARKNGIEIRHRARKLQPSDFESFQLILTMDAANFRDTLSLAHRNGFSNADIRLLRSFDPDSPHPHAEVPDPWYGGEEGFEEVFQILHRSCRTLVNQLEMSINKNRLTE